MTTLELELVELKARVERLEDSVRRLSSDKREVASPVSAEPMDLVKHYILEPGSTWVIVSLSPSPAAMTPSSPPPRPRACLPITPSIMSSLTISFQLPEPRRRRLRVAPVTWRS